MTAKFKITVEDYDNEKSLVTFSGGEWNLLNFNDVEAELNALYLATRDIQIGSFVKDVKIIDDTDHAYVEPVKEAQRETKWLVMYHDIVTGRKYSQEIPCADHSLLDPLRKKYMDKTSAEYLAFEAAFNDFVQSPVINNDVALDDLLLVGRNV